MLLPSTSFAHFPFPLRTRPPQSITKAIVKRIESTMTSRGASDGAGLSILKVDEQQQSGALGKRGRGKTTDIKEKKKARGNKKG